MTWLARLALDYRLAGGCTRLARRHSGPLRVMKALYPEGPQLCHTLVVHPPGGIAGNDHLALDLHVGPAAQALVTTPGATKWYRANAVAVGVDAASLPAGTRTDGGAAQAVTQRIEGGLEWLPQESIVYDHARADSRVDIDLAARGATIGWDIVVLGRGASGESFGNGAFSQTIRLVDDGQLQWVERTRLAGGDALLDSPIGLAGQPVIGCLWAAGPVWRDAELESLRASLGGAPQAAPLTRVAPRLLIARVLAAGAPAARAALTAVWRRLRPRVFDGRAAVPPRIWAT
ncbi:MAG: urease accessory protein UreD [Burkholderiaceae bacterium]|jgi:urease accessory protein|nr:urease accessory protein UreD [Burkholderiaceae bacterium]